MLWYRQPAPSTCWRAWSLVNGRAVPLRAHPCPAPPFRSHAGFRLLRCAAAARSFLPRKVGFVHPPSPPHLVSSFNLTPRSGLDGLH